AAAPTHQPTVPVYPADPWASPVPLPALHFDFTPPDRAAVGLRALGPMPGDADLMRALTPIYEAGATAALAIALGDTADVEDEPLPLVAAEPSPEVVAPVEARPPRTAAPKPPRSTHVAPRGGPMLALDSLLGKAADKPLSERLID